MSCSMCGTSRKPRLYRVTLHDDGSQHEFLSEVEARIYATKHGGGRIEIIRS